MFATCPEWLEVTAPSSTRDHEADLWFRRLAHKEGPASPKPEPGDVRVDRVKEKTMYEGGRVMTRWIRVAGAVAAVEDCGLACCP